MTHFRGMTLFKHRPTVTYGIHFWTKDNIVTECSLLRDFTWILQNKNIKSNNIPVHVNSSLFLFIFPDLHNCSVLPVKQFWKLLPRSESSRLLHQKMHRIRTMDTIFKLQWTIDTTFAFSRILSHLSSFFCILSFSYLQCNTSMQFVAGFCNSISYQEIFASILFSLFSFLYF